MKKFDIYQMITDLIISRLESGVVPWQMPWKAGGVPRNLVSKKMYRGFNFWYLLSFGFENPWFLTRNQINQLGGHIKKGAESYIVTFWKLLERNQKDGSTDEIPMLRYYRVFHIDSTEGIDPEKIPSSQSHDHEFSPIDECDRLVEQWTDSPEIKFGYAQAAYMPGLDEVRMPNARTFFEDEKYYSTLFHELIHSTGHRKRLNRHEKFSNHSFGSKDYSTEELVAEMGAAFLCGITGIENATIDNSAAYLQSWLKKFKDDNKIIVTAASYAQRAADYILEHQNTPAETTAVNIEKETELVSFSL